jgi:hypothetical protein
MILFCFDIFQYIDYGLTNKNNEIMKKFFVLLYLMICVTNVICQSNNQSQTNSQRDSTDQVIVSTGLPITYPLASDRNIEKLKEVRRYHSFIYPLLILNGIIIREEEKVNCFRNNVEFVNIKRTKCISKEKAEKIGIPNVPKDGVLFVTLKKGYYFDFSCEETKRDTTHVFN